MNNHLTERLKKALHIKNMNVNEITTSASLSQGLLHKAFKNRTGLNSDTIEKILDAVPDLNADWLLKGRGEPFSPAGTESSAGERFMIPYLSRNNQRLFPENLHSAEFRASLPRIPFYHTGSSNPSEMVCFEVPDNRMDNGSWESYRKGDLILAREIPSKYWDEQLKIKDWDFAILNRKGNVMICRITEISSEKGQITIHRLNNPEKARNMKTEDILKLYYILRSQQNRKRK